MEKKLEQSVIKTAGRVFQVLEYLREVRRPVTVREISERLGYPLSSTQVLLKSVATLGYLRYDSSARAYLATPRLASIGDWVMDSMFQGGQLLTLLGDIARETRFTAILAVENDIYAQYVHVIFGSHPIQFNVQPGTRRLLCMSGTGWALLAAGSDDHVARTIHRSNVRLKPSGQTVDADYVKARVQESRERGYAFSRGVVTEGIGIVALGSASSASGARFAVGVGGLVEQLERAVDTVVPAMRERLFQFLGSMEATTILAQGGESG
ncbi:IclR family transcriptional regulator [Verminephrobacter aporrectodeae]|uniref:IclR family transcriptional regulator n=1 Tax=Verminephrobacter aporrectodeae TaxID=1110389 RepID=UPI0022374A15|nr:helix-turn-helix domain-containing protein [Verminephrobacter aporrectodeae]